MPSLDAMLLVLAVAAAGWLVGSAAAAFTAYLGSLDGFTGPGEEAETIGRWQRLLWRDPFTQGGCATAWAALLVTLGPGWQFLASALLAVPLVEIAVVDLRSRVVYVLVARATLLLGILLNPVTHGLTTPPGFLMRNLEPALRDPARAVVAMLVGLLGALAGWLIFQAIYLLGKRLYHGQEPLARGDIAIAAMVGAIAGPQAGAALMAGVLFSGLAALALVLARRSTRLYMPYGPGLCLGALLSLLRP